MAVSLFQLHAGEFYYAIIDEKVEEVMCGRMERTENKRIFVDVYSIKEIDTNGRATKIPFKCTKLPIEELFFSARDALLERDFHQTPEGSDNDKTWKQQI